MVFHAIDINWQANKIHFFSTLFFSQLIIIYAVYDSSHIKKETSGRLYNFKIQKLYNITLYKYQVTQYSMEQQTVRISYYRTHFC